jgi:dipeptide transport system permease protein
MSVPIESYSQRLTLYQQWWIEFKANKLALTALIIFCSILILATMAPLLAPYSPNTQFQNASHIPPFWNDSGDIRFLLGTDDIGRDVFSRLLFGAKLSLSIAFLLVSIAAFLGVLFGSALAFSPHYLNDFMMHIVHFILALPSLLLAIFIVAITGPGLSNAMNAVLFVLIPPFIIRSRQAIRSELKRPYTIAMQLDGASTFQLFFYSILPAILPIILLQIAIAFSTAILEIAALGFLGLGAQAPSTEWGNVLSESKNYIAFAPWSIAAPGLAVFLTLLSLNLVSEGFRDVIRLKK